MEGKRRSIPFSALIQDDPLEESSDDSDFRIEDHLDESSEENSSTENDSADSEECKDKYDESSSKKKSDANTTIGKEKVHETHLPKQECKKIELPKILICCVCNGDVSNDDNEIVECDNCGVTVHESCYGVSESDSISSCGSGSSKIPWFCEVCRAGQENLSCELCPNFGGVLKETDTGKWVHLVCALYISGIAFRDVDKLNNVTLFEMSYSKWGERVCSLCHDQQFAQTGVCIRCDAGLCRTYFHATCAQREGLLSEAQSEEMNHADPFYAHCKMHSDKVATKMRKRNWLTFESQMADRKKLYSLSEGCGDLHINVSIKEKIQKFQHKYAESKKNRAQPWVPTQKMARPLTSRASTLRALSRKASLSGINTQALVMNKAHTNALADVHRKWHISPAFNVEYMGYYLDRNSRIRSLKQNLDMQIEENSKLIKEQKELQVVFNQAVKDCNAEVVLNKKLSSQMKIFIQFLSRMNLNKQVSKLNKAVGITSGNQPSSSFAGKLNPVGLQVDNVNVPCVNKKISEIPESLCLKCGTCGLANDQHLLVKCDTCQLYYHLSCLDPPLTRMPKKTKVVGWQCSECVKSSSDSEEELVDTNTPRQLRQLKGTWNNSKSPFRCNTESVIEKEKENQAVNTVTSGDKKSCLSILQPTVCSKQLKIKTKRKMSWGNSNGLADSSPQKIKQDCKNFEVAKANIEPSIVISPVSLGDGRKNVQNRKITLDAIHAPPQKPRISESELSCESCKETGSKANVVTCDECLKGFHFFCLSPPVKKSPKAPGYSWHCADCDPSESDSD